MCNLEIVFENEELIAINKPHGLLVHRTSIAKDAKEFALQKLRDQIGLQVNPAHRLDRKTSGVLLFTKSRAASQEIQPLFDRRQVRKKYLAIVRGFLPLFGTVEYALKDEFKIRDAKTDYQTLEQFEVEIPLNDFPTSRYSLIKLCPLTGRFHQIRRHLAHIFHPIIGDRPHGCNKQNKLWKEKFGLTVMLLHAEELEFNSDRFGKIQITATPSPEFMRALSILGSQLDLKK